MWDPAATGNAHLPTHPPNHAPIVLPFCPPTYLLTFLVGNPSLHVLSQVTGRREALAARLIPIGVVGCSRATSFSPSSPRHASVSALPCWAHTLSWGGQDAGHDVTVASPKGGAPPIDEGSKADGFLSAHTKRHDEDAESQKVELFRHSPCRQPRVKF